MCVSSSQQAFFKRNRSALKPQAKKRQSQTHARMTNGGLEFWPGRERGVCWGALPARLASRVVVARVTKSVNLCQRFALVVIKRPRGITHFDLRERCP